MRRRWFGTHRCVALLLATGVAASAGCGRSSSPRSAPPVAGASGAGRGAATGGASGAGGSSTSGGVAGTLGSPGGSGAVSAGGSTAATSGAAGTSGSSTGGSSGASGGLGGSAGEDTSKAGEGSDAGAGGAASCQDLCKPGKPECCTLDLRCVERVPACRFDVLVATVSTTYDYAELEAKVAALSPDVQVSFTDEDIATAATDPQSSGRFEFHLTAEASAERAGDLLNADLHPFVLTCDGQRLFVGVGYFRGGAAALRTPVLHVERDTDDTLVVRLGAIQGAWGFEDQTPLEYRQRIDRAELRAALCARGILDKL
jgi:hypothetical protein